MVAVPVVVIMAVEIAQDEETAESESSPPERVWNPTIKIAIFPGRRIITHDGRSVFFVIFLEFRGLRVFGNLRGRSGVARFVFGTRT